MINANYLRETARAICRDLPEEELHSHPAWRAADRIEELEGVRDDIRKLVYIGEHMHEDCSWKYRFSEIKDEKDALAAHVKRIHAAFCKYKDSEYGSEEELEAEAYLYDVIEETPATSLAHLKAQWQAEVLEQLFIEMQTTNWGAEILPKIRELRQQAEKLTP
ncbi:hypothetical protein [Vreelandella massiliensis]|uniref:hypothetical protein n=1 Tax=Vreelandella massiliensis TaxID=1816686 RepID=UPI00096A2A70|nr:hypothetical protein [Halomonas massiliensis]